MAPWVYVLRTVFFYKSADVCEQVLGARAEACVYAHMAIQVFMATCADAHMYVCTFACVCVCRQEEILLPNPGHPCIFASLCLCR